MSSMIRMTSRQEAIVNSPQWRLYTTYLPHFGNKTPLEVFEDYIQELYKDIFQQIRCLENSKKQAALLRTFTQFEPKRVIASKPRYITKALPMLLAVYQIYANAKFLIQEQIERTDKMDEDFEALRESTRNELANKHIEDDELSRILYAISIASPVNQIRNIHAAVVNDEQKNKKLINAQQHLLIHERDKTPIKEGSSTQKWERKVYNHLAMMPTRKFVTSSDARRASEILAIVEKLDPNILGCQNEHQDEQALTPSIVLSDGTREAYETVVKIIRKVQGFKQLLTVEESHVLETIKDSLLPDGLKSITEMQQIDEDAAIVADEKYEEILLLSKDKLEGIIERAKSSSAAKLDIYFDASKQILSL